MKKIRPLLTIPLTSIAFWLLATMLCACSSAQPPALPANFKEGGTFDVEAVYLHEPGSYSVAVRNGTDLSIVALRASWDWQPGHGHQPIVVLRTDAKPGEPIRVEFRNRLVFPDDNEVITTFIIHLHGARDINGAGWSHRIAPTRHTPGYFERGDTRVIEN